MGKFQLTLFHFPAFLGVGSICFADFCRVPSGQGKPGKPGKGAVFRKSQGKPGKVRELFEFSEKCGKGQGIFFPECLEFDGF